MPVVSAAPVIVEQPALILSGADCLALEHHLGRVLDQARTRLDGTSRAYRVLIELRTAAALHVAQQADLRTTAKCDDDRPQTGASFSGVAAIADRCGVTEQAIRAAASAGRLAGTKDDRGRWQFTPGAVADFEERRQR